MKLPPSTLPIIHYFSQISKLCKKGSYNCRCYESRKSFWNRGTQSWWWRSSDCWHLNASIRGWGSFSWNRYIAFSWWHSMAKKCSNYWTQAGERESAESVFLTLHTRNVQNIENILWREAVFYQNFIMKNSINKSINVQIPTIIIFLESPDPRNMHELQ